MGIKSSQPSDTQERDFKTEYNSSHHTPTFISPVATHYRALSEFRGKLSSRQCTYTFTILYQRYSELIKRNQKIFISDQHCKVNIFGEIQVSEISNTKEKASTLKLPNMLYKLFELVNTLSIQYQWSQDKSVTKMKQKINQLISNSENQYQLYHKIKKEFSQFFNKAKTQCNLISALNRQKQHKKSKFIYEDSIKQNRNVFHPSFANISIFSTSFVDNIESISIIDRKKQRLSFLSNFYNNTKRQQNSQTQSYYPNIRFQDSFEKPVQIKSKNKNKKFLNSLYISHQFSINIISNKNTKRKSSNQILKVKRYRYRTQTLGSSSSPQNQQLKIAKNRTAVELHDNKNQRSSKNLPKSVLDTMARLVQVQDFSSSKSHIN